MSASSPKGLRQRAEVLELSFSATQQIVINARELVSRLHAGLEGATSMSVVPHQNAIAAGKITRVCSHDRREAKLLTGCCAVNLLAQVLSRWQVSAQFFLQLIACWHRSDVKTRSDLICHKEHFLGPNIYEKERVGQRTFLEEGARQISGLLVLCWSSKLVGIN